MTLRSTLWRLLVGPPRSEKPLCAGCERPVATAGDVCTDCTNKPLETYGG